MKNQSLISNSETFEDIIFEGRNKSYGAYELNRKHRKYLFFAFLISLFGVSTAIAVPFLNSFKNKIQSAIINGGVTIDLIPVKPKSDIETPPPPPPPPHRILKDFEKHLAYITPIVVEDPVYDEPFIHDDLIDKIFNPPVEIPLEPVKTEPFGIIESPEDTIFTSVEEDAGFMGGGIEEFHKWVLKNITYPQVAIENGVFGRVLIEFCVNTKGQVVDIRFLRSIHPSVDSETTRVLSSSPLWTPAKQGGKPVKQRFTIPFVFRML